MLKFGTDITGLRLERQLGQTTSRVNRSLERLSSGLRINRPSDDAAGLQISESLQAESRILNQARRNVSDAVSVLNITAAVVEEVTGIQTRMAELATQAASSSLSDKQRGALNAEFFALSAEARRIITEAEFNGISLGRDLNADYDAQQLTNIVGGAGIDVSRFDLSDDGRFAVYVNSSVGAIELLDTTTGAIQTIASGVIPTGIASLQISASGSTIVFESTADLTGENGSNFNQVFAYDRLAGELSQVTDAQAAELGLSDMTLAGDGQTLFFSTFTRYVDGGTLEDGPTGSDVTEQMYSLNLSTGVFNEIIAPTVGGFYGNYALSENGQYLTFTSSTNVTGENPGNGVQLFILDMSDPNGTLRQITSTPLLLDNLNSVVLNDGTVFFTSGRDETGQNPSGATQIFSYRYENDSLTQITQETTGAASLELSADQSYLVITSNQNYTGENPQGQFQGFEYDIASGTFTQTTNSSLTPAINIFRQINNSSFIIASSNADLTGENADGNLELFLFRAGGNPAELTVALGGSAENNITIELDALLETAQSLSGLTLGSRQEARGAVDSIKKDLAALGEYAGKIGANISRLDVAASELANRSTELQAAASRIRDVDVAEEAAALVRNALIQQAVASLIQQNNLNATLLLELLDINS